jgi:hypothetical protein
VREQTYLLLFTGVSAADANRYAEELREALLNATTEIAVQRQRENPLAQDLGATLALIMGTTGFVAAVNAIGNWLQKRHSATLTIVTAEKKIVAENLTNKDAAHLLQLFLTQNAEHKEPGP